MCIRDSDIDHEGKDSWRHRQAGAYEVVIASERRLAMVREFEQRGAPTVHDLLAALSACDWVLVEGFKSAALPKIEIWRAAAGKPAQYPTDSHIVAVCTDSPGALPQPTTLPLLNLNDADAVADFLLSHPERYEYIAPRDTHHLGGAEGADAHAGRSDEPAARRRPGPADD